MPAIDNSYKQFSNLFQSDWLFRVPPYQRAYAWGAKQLGEFLEDIASHEENKGEYFLGTFLLMEYGPRSGIKELHVVDGQQRLTTFILFVAALRNAWPELLDARQLRKYLIEDGLQRFSTIDEDNPFLRSLLDPMTTPLDPPQTPSGRRIQNAYDVFCRKLRSVDRDTVRQWLTTIETAGILTYTVRDLASASVIFETVNDRGKRLTDLESVKSFLMHTAYALSLSPTAGEQKLAEVQALFARIYREVEQLEDVVKEDDGLRYAYLAFHPGSFEGDLKDHLKQTIRAQRTQNLEACKARCDEFVRQLSLAFPRLRKIALNSDRVEALGRVLALRRVANFYPLLLRVYAERDDPGFSDYTRILQLCEIISLKIWGIGNYRADKALTHLTSMAHGFTDRPSVIEKLKEMLTWWEIPQRWEAGLNGALFYQEKSDARYILFQYENWLREEGGYAPMPLEDLGSDDPRTRLTIEHIAAQQGMENVEKLLIALDSPLAPIADAREFEKTYLHHIGNLVIDPQSPNSSRGKIPVVEKVPGFRTAPLLSQSELHDDLQQNGGRWDATAIRRRGERLIRFAHKEWDETRV